MSQPLWRRENWGGMRRRVGWVIWGFGPSTGRSPDLWSRQQVDVVSHARCRAQNQAGAAGAMGVQAWPGPMQGGGTLAECPLVRKLVRVCSEREIGHGVDSAQSDMRFSGQVKGPFCFVTLNLRAECYISASGASWRLPCEHSRCGCDEACLCVCEPQAANPLCVSPVSAGWLSPTPPGAAALYRRRW